MQTFVKLRPSSRLSYLNLTVDPTVEAKVNVNNFCMDVNPSVAEITSGKDEGKRTSIIEAGQSFTVRLGTVAPRKYTMLLVLPLVLTNRIAQGPTGPVMVEEDEKTELTFEFKALRKIDLQDLPYFARIYLID